MPPAILAFAPRKALFDVDSAVMIVTIREEKMATKGVDFTLSICEHSSCDRPNPREGSGGPNSSLGCIPASDGWDGQLFEPEPVS